MIRRAGLRHSFGRAGRVADEGGEVGCDSDAEAVGGVVGASIGFQFLKQRSHAASVHRTVMQR